MNTRYFTPEALSFLTELGENNEKAWFEKNKDRYESGLRAPALELIRDLAPVFARTSPRLVADPRGNGGSLSRIHRDTRFSTNKAPYKTALFLRFYHDGANEELLSPGFYLHLGPGDSRAGAGVWQAPPVGLERIRRAIIDRPDAWRTARAGGVGGMGCNLGGEQLKKVPRGFDPNHEFADDLRRKGFGLHAPLADDVVTGPELLPAIEGALVGATPLLRFLCEAVGLPF